MKELIQVRDAVTEALRRGGLTAMTAFPDGRRKAYDGAVAVVSVGTAESRAIGFCNYLGEADGGGELYGRQLEAVITVDVRGERAAVCETGCETAAEVLLGGLPSGIRPGELTWEALCWERETEMFLRRGQLRCRAVFLAKTDGEDTAFLDFNLKGVLKS